MDRESIKERFGIVGRSSALRNAIDRARLVARTDITVLIQGESGTGKELIAEAIHGLSARRRQSFVIVNCGAIPEGLIESELFGAEKGAYTGAVERRTGYFEQADGGTIFLDEIGEMPPAAQVRLLRVLESGQFARVGASQLRKADVRILAATNKDLAHEVRAGRFREDLYYRLSTVLVETPPLRRRPEDILPLLETFLRRYAQKYDSPVKQLSADARELLMRYRWPGNVRELRNVAEQVEVLVQGKEVSAEDIRPYLRGVRTDQDRSALLPVVHKGGGAPMDAREREIIYRALFELRAQVRRMWEEMKRRGAVSGDETDEYPPPIEDVPYEIEGDADALLWSGNDMDAGGRDAAEPEAPRTAAEDASADEAKAEEETEESGEPEESEEETFPTLEAAERKLIASALKAFDGNRRRTARTLGISERTLYRKLKEFEEDL